MKLKSPGKPFEISKWAVQEAWEKVKANKGAPGVDGVSIEAFEADLQDKPVQGLECVQQGGRSGYEFGVVDLRVRKARRRLPVEVPVRVAARRAPVADWRLGLEQRGRGRSPVSKSPVIGGARMRSVA